MSCPCWRAIVHGKTSGKSTEYEQVIAISTVIPPLPLSWDLTCGLWDVGCRMNLKTGLVPQPQLTSTGAGWRHTGLTSQRSLPMPRGHSRLSRPLLAPHPTPTYRFQRPPTPNPKERFNAWQRNTSVVTRRNLIDLYVHWHTTEEERGSTTSNRKVSQCFIGLFRAANVSR